jgi:glutathione synthase
MPIAFLMDKLESIDPENETTPCLMYECNQRGHTVYFLEPHDVYIRDDEIVARMRNITVEADLSITKYWQAVKRCLRKDELLFETLTDIMHYF